MLKQLAGRGRAAAPGVGFALLLVGAATAGLFALLRWAELRDVAVVYLLPVLIAAMRWGELPAIVAAVAGIAASAYFFYDPIYDLRVNDPQQLVNMLLFVIVAVVTGRLATRLRRELDLAAGREADLRRLYAFSRQLAGANAAADIYSAIQQHLSAALARTVVLFGGAESGQPQQFGQAAVPAGVRDAVEHAVKGAAVRAPDPADCGGDAWLVAPVAREIRDFGVIAVNLGDPSLAAAREMRERIDAVLADASRTLERLGVGRAISEARMRALTDRFREALIGSVSHELRTPLASILGAATVLASAPAVAREPRLASLAALARDAAVRLNNEIQNLLDASRISGEGLQPKLEWAEPADIVNAALERRREQLARHRVDIDLGGELPLVYVDAALIEQALGQVLDNAAKFSPAGSCIGVTARCRDREVTIAVSDQGHGFAPEDAPRLGERFYRGASTAAATAGSGLGLWIAGAFLRANAGRVEWRSDGEGLGATVSLHMPAPAPVAEAQAQARELAHE
jgi:two-component system, OmpR family, sensor histidine kinase KdpD